MVTVTITKKNATKFAKLGTAKPKGFANLEFKSKEEVVEIIYAIDGRLDAGDKLFKSTMKAGQKLAAEDIAFSMSRLRQIRDRLTEDAGVEAPEDDEESEDEDEDEEESDD